MPQVLQPAVNGKLIKNLPLVSPHNHPMQPVKIDRSGWMSSMNQLTVRKLSLVIVAISMVSALFSQGIRDSVFRIDAVEIIADRIFAKEEAGMKQEELDTAILQEKANLSLSDLLSENTSVFIKNHGRGALATASFRGTAASHTQVVWNGLNINTPMAGMVDFALIPVYIIDDVTLKYGAASLADQAGGIGGSINIANSADWERGTKVQYIQGVGSYSTFDEFLQVGIGNQKIRSKTRVYHNYSNNDYTFINRGIGNIDPVTGNVTNPVDTNENAGYKRYGLLQEIYFRPHPEHVASVKYWGQHADRSIPRPTSFEGPDNSNLNNQMDNDHRLVGDWKYYGPYGKILFRSGYSVKQLNYEQENRVPGLGLIPSIYSESRQQSFINNLSYSYDMDSGLSFEGSLQFNHHHVNSRDTVSRTGYEKQRDEISIFTAIRKSYADRLNVNLMLRQDWVDGKRIPLIPFFGLDYRLIKGADLVLKGCIARNYHPPTLNDLYWQPGGNSALKPEKGFSLEAGLEYQLVLSRHKLKTGITAYRSDIDNWIVWIPSFKGYWEPRNINEVLSTGVEYDLQLNGYLGKLRYRVTGSYAYTRSVSYGDTLVWSDASYGKQLVYIPLHSGNLMVSLAFHHFFITYQYNAYSERYTTSSNDLTRRDWLYPYFMNDLGLGGELMFGQTTLSAELKIYNLFNESYHSVLYRPMPGRNYCLVIKFRI
jgi:outer membrane cobalamin receptor